MGTLDSAAFCHSTLLKPFIPHYKLYPVFRAPLTMKFQAKHVLTFLALALIACSGYDSDERLTDFRLGLEQGDWVRVKADPTNRLYYVGTKDYCQDRGEWLVQLMYRSSDDGDWCWEIYRSVTGWGYHSETEIKWDHRHPDKLTCEVCSQIY